MKTKHYATLRVDDSVGGYRKLEITVSITDAPSYRAELFTLRWQSDRERTEWYGLSVAIEQNNWEALARVAQAAAFLRKHPPGDDPRAWFEATGLPVYVDDRREGKAIPLDAVKPAEFDRFMAIGPDHSCIVSAVCQEADAERALLRAFAADVAQWGSSDTARQMEQWIAAGKPVRIDRHAKAPWVPDMATVWNSLGTDVANSNA